MNDKVKEIKEKGFNMQTLDDEEGFPTEGFNVVDFSKIKVGIKTMSDATLKLNDFNKVNSRLGDKDFILQSIDRQDFQSMTEISLFFFRQSGIYTRLCKYMAYMYKYDWYVTPYVISKKMKKEKILNDFNKILLYLDNFNIKKFLGEVALQVFKTGSYYGYITHYADRATVQELPAKYCRSRFFSQEGAPVIEFNMKFFDDSFKDQTQKERMLKLFPEEFEKGYKLYKAGRLPAEFQGDNAGWYLLDTERAFKFNLNGDDFPPLISVIPAIINLNEAQNLDKKKLEQQLLKIIIQKMPLDKNGDLVFDVDEARDLHNNAVAMLGKAIGVDVLTTFADVDVADMASNAGVSATDEGMDRIKANVYDEAGVSQMQFNTDGNIALEKSILNDEGSLSNLIQQFEQFLNMLIKPFNRTPKKIIYRVHLLNTTVYNYKEMSKIYKEQTQLGYSKMLPQIALGHSQSSILANAYFENDILDLVSIFIPPMSSNTMNADAMKNRKDGDGKKPASGEEKKAGRPEKEDDEKSEKTIQNKESAN